MVLQQHWGQERQLSKSCSLYNNIGDRQDNWPNYVPLITTLGTGKMTPNYVPLQQHWGQAWWFCPNYVPFTTTLGTSKTTPNYVPITTTLGTVLMVLSKLFSLYNNTGDKQDNSKLCSLYNNIGGQARQLSKLCSLYNNIGGQARQLSKSCSLYNIGDRPDGSVQIIFHRGQAK